MENFGAKLATVAVLFLTATIIVAMGALVMDDTVNVATNSTVFYKYGEAITVYDSNTTEHVNSSLSAALVQEGTLVIYNSTPTSLDLGNVTVNYQLGTIALSKANHEIVNGSALTADFGYLTNGYAWNASYDSRRGLANFSGWAPTLATIFIAGLLISVIFGAFYLGRR